MFKVDYRHRYDCLLNGESGLAAHSTREVFLFEDVVLKLDKVNTTKRPQNETELFNYSLIDPEDVKFFAPLVEYGYLDDGRLYLIQERVKYDDVVPLTRKLTAKFHEIAIKYNLSDVVLGYEADSGNHCNFYGVRNGFKIYDLGCETNFKFISQCTYTGPQEDLPF